MFLRKNSKLRLDRKKKYYERRQDIFTKTVIQFFNIIILKLIILLFQEFFTFARKNLKDRVEVKVKSKQSITKGDIFTDTVHQSF